MHSIRLLRLPQQLAIQYRHISNEITKQAEEQQNLQEQLLSDTNRERCMKALKQSPPLGAKLKPFQTEQHYAAVLIALCTDNETRKLSLLYTRRSALLSRHKRQISFPGGLRDSVDNHYIDCALRETEEEIGLHRERIEVWGECALVRPPQTAAIMPVVGVVRDFDLNELILNEQEVEEAFTVPIADLVHPNSFGHTQFKSGYSSPVFVVGEHRIWGITGYMTYMFLNCLIPPELGGLTKRIKYVRPYKTIAKS